MGGVVDAVTDFAGDLVGGITGATAADAARDASDAQLQANRENIAFQQQLFNALSGQNAYGAGIGNQALGQMASLYGLTPGYNPAGQYTFGDDGKIVHTPGTAPAGGAASTPDFSAFFNSPDYAYTRDETMRALGQNQAARGNLFSGGAGRELAQTASGLASQNFGNYWNRLAGLAGVGQTATQQTSNALQGVGQNISNSMLNMGNARASGYINAANANQAGIGNILGLVGGGLGIAGNLGWSPFSSNAPTVTSNTGGIRIG